MPVVDLRLLSLGWLRLKIDVVLWIIKLLVLVIELVIRWREKLVRSLIMIILRRLEMTLTS